MLYADDLVIAADTVEELTIRVERWKSNLESKGLRVNMGKTKVLCSGKDLNVLVNSSLKMALWSVQERCRQKLDLLHRMPALDPQSMQWHQGKAPS